MSWEDEIKKILYQRIVVEIDKLAEDLSLARTLRQVYYPEEELKVKVREALELEG